jgi:hypothetical protein
MRRPKKSANAENRQKASQKTDSTDPEAAPATLEPASANGEKEKAPLPITYQQSRQVALLKLALISRTLSE